jgi:hypothetical protein
MKNLVKYILNFKRFLWVKYEPGVEEKSCVESCGNPFHQLTPNPLMN